MRNRTALVSAVTFIDKEKAGEVKWDSWKSRAKSWVSQASPQADLAGLTFLGRNLQMAPCHPFTYSQQGMDDVGSMV